MRSEKIYYRRATNPFLFSKIVRQNWNKNSIIIISISSENYFKRLNENNLPLTKINTNNSFIFKTSHSLNIVIQIVLDRFVAFWYCLQFQRFTFCHNWEVIFQSYLSIPTLILLKTFETKLKKRIVFIQKFFFQKNWNS